MRKTISGNPDLVRGKTVKHEGVIGIWTMGNGYVDYRIGVGFFSLLGAHGEGGPFKGRTRDEVLDAVNQNGAENGSN
jgi:hypothetical protein